MDVQHRSVTSGTPLTVASPSAGACEVNLDRHGERWNGLICPGSRAGWNLRFVPQSSAVRLNRRNCSRRLEGLSGRMLRADSTPKPSWAAPTPALSGLRAAQLWRSEGIQRIRRGMAVSCERCLYTMLARRRAEHAERRSVSSAPPGPACRGLCGKVFRARLDRAAGSQKLRGIPRQSQWIREFVCDASGQTGGLVWSATQVSAIQELGELGAGCEKLTAP